MKISFDSLIRATFMRQDYKCARCGKDIDELNYWFDIEREIVYCNECGGYEKNGGF